MGYSQPRRIEEFIAQEIGLALFYLALALAQSALLPHINGMTVSTPLLLLHALQRAGLSGPATAAAKAFYGGLAL